jgi:Holliday junction resolvasome RuvABC DNA-binding subunit
VNSQASLFTSLPGIGKKISERLCFELSEKVHKAMGEGVLEDPRSFSENSSSSEGVSAQHTVLEALLSLGFARREALTALKEVLASEEKASTDESTLLHQALRRLQP